MNRDREQKATDVTLLQFLRTFRTDTQKATRYKVKRAVLVGVKYFSYFNPCYFFQHNLMNVPFREIKDITHPNVETCAEGFQEKSQHLDA